MNVNVKLAAIEDLSIRKPEEGKTYVVFRDVETNSKISKYSICVYRAGNWIPEIVADMKWPGFEGIPVTDMDKWINIDDAFAPAADEAPEEKEKPVDGTTDYVLSEMKRHIENHEQRLQQLERSNTSPLQPAIPAPYPPYSPYTPYVPVTPGPTWPPEIWYSIGTGAPYLKPGEITCTYNYVPSKENK